MSDLDVVHRWVDGGLAALESSRGRIDDLNVYPVPDGDTGTNLTSPCARSSTRSTSRGGRPRALAREVTRGG